MKIQQLQIEKFIKQALEEDKAKNDITTKALFLDKHKVNAFIEVKQKCVLAGIEIARLVFAAVDKRISICTKYKDGITLNPSTKVMSIEGSIKSIFSAERIALNILSRLSGIATMTDEFAKAAYPVRIYDTRKTTPGIRFLEKYAVKVGGGYNHRMDLEEHFLVKDNHINSFKKIYPDKTIEDIIEKVKSSRKNKIIEIEVENLIDFEQALKAQAGIIMLDNMNIEDIKKALELKNSNSYRKKPIIEVSGGMDIKRVKSLGKLPIDRISVGRLTHSIQNIDFSLEIE